MIHGQNSGSAWISAAPSSIISGGGSPRRPLPIRTLDWLHACRPPMPIRTTFSVVDWRRYGPSSDDSSARFRRSRRSFPGLKPGAYLSGSDTGVPVLGLRPTRARRNRIEKLPKPRISIRPPRERHPVMCSSIMFTANATSRSTRWDCVCAIRWISSDFVIGPLSHRRRRDVLDRTTMPTSPPEVVSPIPALVRDRISVRPTRSSAAALRSTDHAFRSQSSARCGAWTTMRSRNRAWCRGRTSPLYRRIARCVCNVRRRLCKRTLNSRSG